MASLSVVFSFVVTFGFLFVLEVSTIVGGRTLRDIVFHGDVMNTAARLEQATRDLDRCFLVSADALGRLAGTERYALEAPGPQALRGRAAPVEVYSCAEGHACR